MEKKNKFADKKNKNDDAFKMEKKLNVDDNKKKFGCKKIKKKKKLRASPRILLTV
jgi:hypothetical protein